MTLIYVTPSAELRTILLRLKRESKKDRMEIDDVYKVVSEFNERYPSEAVEISSLLENVEIEKTRPLPKVPEMSEMELMRLRAGERKYQRSIADLPSLKTITAARSDIKSASESIAFASHFVLAFGSAFLLGYYLGEYIFEFQKDEYKYMMGGACSFLTLILESALFIIRDQKQTSAAGNQAKVATRQALSGGSELMGKAKVANSNSVRKRA